MLHRYRASFGIRAALKQQRLRLFSTTARTDSRLINVNTMQMKEFFENDTPEYATLSHTWASPQEEVSFAQYNSNEKRETFGYQKIVFCVAFAKAWKLEWAWIDTCCIDKTSSAELSEAINSMYSWYQKSTVCCAFLTDVDIGDSKPLIQPPAPKESLEATVAPSEITDSDLLLKLQQCRWFTRGWTLQELLAPPVLVFFDAKLNIVGTRVGLAEHIALITGIDRRYLTGEKTIDEASVAQRMNWVSRRATSRAEDIAYCMLGLFNVNMPLLYGEGGRAFHRLQEHITLESSDELIFAWISDIDRPRGLLAEHAGEFAVFELGRSVWSQV